MSLINMGEKGILFVSLKKKSSEVRKETLNVENISYVRLIPTSCFKVAVTWFLASRNSWVVWMQRSQSWWKQRFKFLLLSLRGPTPDPVLSLVLAFSHKWGQAYQVLCSGMLLHSKCWSILRSIFGNSILNFYWENISGKVAWKAGTCSLLREHRALRMQSVVLKEKRLDQSYIKFLSRSIMFENF